MNIKRPKSLSPGSVLQSRYTIEGPLGQGGFASVYRAVQNATGQHVAIKVMHAPEEADATEVGRFEREMQLVGQLKHPNIVGLVDSGRMANDELFIALEFIDGIALSDLLSERGGLPLRETMRIMGQVLEAMAYAHRHGVVHRDLKPANIMVTEPGRRANAVVLDFGIAGLLDSARGADYQSLTADGQLPGTPAYMAPEQFNPRIPVTLALDVYAWGLTTIECLTGRPACPADGVVQTMIWQTSSDAVTVPVALEGTPLWRLLQRATAKDLDQRYANANEVLGDLEQINFRDPIFDLAAERLSSGGRDPGETTPQNPISFDATIDAPGALDEVRAMLDAQDAERGLQGAVTAPTEMDPPTSVSDDDATTRMSAPDPKLMETARTQTATRRTPAGLWLLGALGLAILLGLVAWIVVGAGDGNPGEGESADDDAAETSAPGPAPDCQRGRLITDETAGQCCWPGQRWDRDANRCAGVPEGCPAGFVVEGEACVETPTAPEGAAGMPRATVVAIASLVPSDAEVLVDGVVVGQGAATYPVTPGDEPTVVALRARGHKTSVSSHAPGEAIDLGHVILEVSGSRDAPSGTAFIPAGTFWRGCSEDDEARCGASEKPGREIELSAFAIDETETSIAAYRTCVDAGACAPIAPPAGKSGADCLQDEPDTNAGLPVVCVTWDQAASFCAWRDMELPTEAQWERAVRGDAGSMYPWGDAAPSCEVAVLRDATGPGCGVGRPRHVWSRPAGMSPWGVVGASGNVSEWTRDFYAPDAYASGNSVDPQGPDSGESRVKRGGDYEDDDPAEMRGSMRDSERPDDHDDDMGFRCVWQPPQAE